MPSGKGFFMENTLPDFLIIPSQIIVDKELQPLDGYVYGVVYWYRKLKLEKCIASSDKIAQILNSTEGGVQNSINRLTKKGYIKSAYDRKKHQRELIPLIAFHKSTTSNDVVPPHQMMTSTTSNDVSTQPQIRTPNKNTKEEEINNTFKGEKSLLTKLPTLVKDRAHIAYLSESVVLEQTGEHHSLKYYRLVAAKIPERVIRETLSEIKTDGADSPGRVFAYRMERYAMAHLQDKVALAH